MDRVKGANRLATPSLNIAHRQTYFDLAPYCVFKQSESSPIFGNGQIFLKLQALTSLEKTQLCFLGPCDSCHAYGAAALKLLAFAQSLRKSKP